MANEMDQNKPHPRQAATQTLLSKIRRAARKLARDGVSNQSAIEALAIEAGYPGGWHELLHAAEGERTATPFLLPEMDRGLRKVRRLDRTPIWDRSMAELEEWFERPFVDCDGPHHRSMFLCLDGRVWNEPSLIAEWDEEYAVDEKVALAKERFTYRLANSAFEVVKDHMRENTWRVVRRGAYSAFAADLVLTAPLYIRQSHENACKRVELLCQIRQRRMRDLDRLFSLPGLFRA